MVPDQFIGEYCARCHPQGLIWEGIVTKLSVHRVVLMISNIVSTRGKLF